MIMNGLLKCNVCGKITQIKIEVSSESIKYPIYIPCKNCDTLFYGEYLQDDENVIAHAKFINAEDISGQHETPDYIAAITGDFISKKVDNVVGIKDTIQLPKWMIFKDRIGINNYTTLINNINSLNIAKNVAVFEWARVMDLWFNKKYEYLKDQLEDFLDATENNILLNDERNYLSAIRKLTCITTMGLFFDGAYDKFVERTRRQCRALYTQNPDKLKGFINELQEKNLFIRLEKLKII